MLDSSGPSRFALVIFSCSSSSCLSFTFRTLFAVSSVWAAFVFLFLQFLHTIHVFLDVEAVWIQAARTILLSFSVFQTGAAHFDFPLSLLTF
jgi:hypothetical protein